MSKEKTEEQYQQDFTDFMQGFSAALKIVNAGTLETRVHIYGVADGKDFVLTIRQATKEEAAESTGCMTVENAVIDHD